MIFSILFCSIDIFYRAPRGNRSVQIKNEKALLDYNDLIILANQLLENSQHSSFIKMKMDSGFDHILIDESQDTNIKQWNIIKALSEDFFSGEGASSKDRSIFIVGDEKQLLAHTLEHVNSLRNAINQRVSLPNDTIAIENKRFGLIEQLFRFRDVHFTLLVRHRSIDLCRGRYSLRLISFPRGSDFVLNENGTRCD